MAKKWIKFTMPYNENHSVIEMRKWCEENCRGRFSVRDTDTFYYSLGLYKLQFQYEDDAVGFKINFS